MPIVIPALGALSARALVIAGGYADARTHEEGGNNKGDQVEFFQSLMGGGAGDPWCADFVCTCLIKAYAQLTNQPESRADLPHYKPAVCSNYFPLSGYCPALQVGASMRHLWHPGHAYVALPGDLVLFDFLERGEPHHVEFVFDWPRRRTIGGNTGAGAGGNQGEGDGVFRRDRSASVGHVFGFISLR